MEIWLDTANRSIIEKAVGLGTGIVYGVTTNPSIISSESASTPLEVLIMDILELHSGPVAVQVIDTDTAGMIRQAKALHAFSSRIIVKIPVTQNGIRAMCALSKEGVLCMATAIFEPRQALLAFKAGARYLAPYLGKIADTGSCPIEVLVYMKMLKENYSFTGEIIAAGVREVSEVISCADVGVKAITLPPTVFEELVSDNKNTQMALEKFSVDWKKACKTPLFAGC